MVAAATKRTQRTRKGWDECDLARDREELCMGSAWGGALLTLPSRRRRHNPGVWLGHWGRRPPNLRNRRRMRSQRGCWRRRREMRQGNDLPDHWHPPGIRRTLAESLLRRWRMTVPDADAGQVEDLVEPLRAHAHADVRGIADPLHQPTRGDRIGQPEGLVVDEDVRETIDELLLGRRESPTQALTEGNVERNRPPATA